MLIRLMCGIHGPISDEMAKDRASGSCKKPSVIYKMLPHNNLLFLFSLKTIYRLKAFM